MDMSNPGLAFPKDTREDGKRKRDAAKAQVRYNEDEQKALVVERDGSHYCRLVPGCSERGRRFETAHLNDKGMGGDPKGIRSVAELMVRVCWYHHQGNWSLHSGDLRVTFLDPVLKANGPIEVWGRLSTGEWAMVGYERAVGEWVRD